MDGRKRTVRTSSLPRIGRYLTVAAFTLLAGACSGHRGRQPVCDNLTERARSDWTVATGEFCRVDAPTQAQIEAVMAEEERFLRGEGLSVNMTSPLTANPAGPMHGLFEIVDVCARSEEQRRIACGTKGTPVIPTPPPSPIPLPILPTTPPDAGTTLTPPPPPDADMPSVEATSPPMPPAQDGGPSKIHQPPIKIRRDGGISARRDAGSISIPLPK